MCPSSAERTRPAERPRPFEQIDAGHGISTPEERERHTGIRGGGRERLRDRIGELDGPVSRRDGLGELATLGRAPRQRREAERYRVAGQPVTLARGLAVKRAVRSENGLGLVVITAADQRLSEEEPRRPPGAPDRRTRLPDARPPAR
jgi:hypothetical protein